MHRSQVFKEVSFLSHWLDYYRFRYFQDTRVKKTCLLPTLLAALARILVTSVAHRGVLGTDIRCSRFP